MKEKKRSCRVVELGGCSLVRYCFVGGHIVSYDAASCGWWCWSYGVMVSTLDFESSDPGSNPGRTFLFFSWSEGVDCRALISCHSAPCVDTYKWTVTLYILKCSVTVFFSWVLWGHRKSVTTRGWCWSYGVMVSTLDSESSDPGSNPGRTSL